MAELTNQIFRKEVKFIAGAEKPSQLPSLFLPQIAFFGKSNVGKSSLVNNVCRSKSLARVSNTPGRTQQINFFSVANKLLITDLPGYGFAKVSQLKRFSWERLITNYFQYEKNLLLVNLLIDARRSIKDNDIEIIRLLKLYNVSFQIILTKSDKVNIDDNYLSNIHQSLKTFECNCNIIITSSKSGKGIKELQLSMLNCIKRA